MVHTLNSRSVAMVFWISGVLWLEQRTFLGRGTVKVAAEHNTNNIV